MKIVTVVGARPQFIKAGPVSAALREAGIDEFLLHTGQHYDDRMSAVFFADLELRQPDLNLNAGSGSHATQTARMLEGIEACLLEQQPDALLVYGDTNSTLAGALAAAKLQVPIAHVEAGLRSFNRAMPEEINRIVTDRLSDRLYCPSEAARQHLAAEGNADGAVVVGDVMHDALRRYLPRARERSDVLSRLGLTEGSYVVATLHRPALVDDPDLLLPVLQALADLPSHVVLPMHPRTRARLAGIAWDAESVTGLTVIDPVGYLDMIRLVAGARHVATDSGGLQKEAYWLRKPCVTLRTETEWTETVDAGWNQVVGVDPTRLATALHEPEPTEHPELYGDGHAAQRIAGDLANLSGAPAAAIP